MAVETKIDKQGRIIIPAEYRKKMNISVNSILVMSFIGNQLIIRKQPSIDEKDIELWKNKIKTFDLTPNTDTNIEFKEKWMSEDYIRDKLGI